MMDTKRISFSSAETFPLKVCIHRGLLEGIREGYIKPIHLQFMPTNKCNLNCSFCSCSKRDKDLEFPIKEVAELSSLMAELGCRAVSITGGGEPLMHPYINEMIYMLFVNDMDIGLVTNGLLLDKLYSGDAITWCRISCSDERKLTEKYEVILDRSVINNKNIDWSFSYVVSTPERFDIDNLVKMVEFANEHKFTHVRVVSDLIDIRNTVSMAAIQDGLSDLVDDSLVIYQGRNIWDHGTKNCLISLLKPTVGADGYVYPCCGVQYARGDCDLDTPADMRMGHWKDMESLVHYDGSACIRCYYKNYNDLLGLLTSDIQHKNFL